MLYEVITQQFTNSGIFSSLSELGFETQRDGTLEIDDDRLTSAVSDNLNSIVGLLAGEGSNDGIAAQFENYLDSLTDSFSGMLQSKTESINSIV